MLGRRPNDGRVRIVRMSCCCPQGSWSLFRTICWCCCLVLLLLDGGVVGVDVPGGGTSLPLSERAALIEFFASTSGASWKNSTGWNTAAPICSWLGVVCMDWNTGMIGTTTQDSGVISIQLSDNNVAHDISPELYLNLPTLQSLDLSQNPLTNAHFEALVRDDETKTTGKPPPPLERIDLSFCFLEDVSGLQGAAATLTQVKLTGNSFTAFPTELYALTRLERLYINAMSSMKGSLDTDGVANWNRSLVEFYAYDNALTGTLPTTLGLLSKLQVLSLSSNAFHGTLPTEFNQLINLQVLSLHGDSSPREFSAAGNHDRPGMSLTGRVLSFSRIPRLSKLFLSDNEFTGPLPDDFLKFHDHDHDTKDIVLINLQRNFLTGGIPLSLRQFTSLHLNLVDNLITEPIPDFLCAKARWMHGLVAVYGCDAILCPAGTYSPEGQQTSPTTQCQPCPPTNYLVHYWGATTCPGQQSQHTNTGTGPAKDPSHDTLDRTAEDTTLALLEFYVSLDGPRWETNAGWEVFDALTTGTNKVAFANNPQSGILGQVEYCQFYGIICNGNTGHVLFLTLANNRLHGTLPPTTLASLSQLVSLDISYNPGLHIENLSGLSPTVTRLKLSHVVVTKLSGISAAADSLTSLFLSGVDMPDGTLPDELFQLTALETLQMDASNIAGPLSTNIAQLTNLRRLYLNENQLQGPIPATQLNQLTNLEYLDLSDNDWIGTLPSDFLSDAVHLTEFRLNGARAKRLGGPLPSLETWTYAEVVELAYNNFTGSIPSTFLQNARTLVRNFITVRLQGNALTGTLPAEWASFDTPLNVYLHDNHITGIPAVLCEQSSWMNGVVGHVGCDAILCAPGSYNPHDGHATVDNVCDPCPTNPQWWGQSDCPEDATTLPNREREILDELYQATGGRYWNQTHDAWDVPSNPICQREGVVCVTGPYEETGVSELRLEHFGLRGTIPTSVYQLPSLRRLAVGFNPVQLPFDGIHQATQLEVIQASATIMPLNLTSLMTQSTSPPPRLYELHLAHVTWPGPFPSELMHITSLRDLRLSDNHFTGPLPRDGWEAWTNLELLDLSENDLQGLLPPDMGQMTKLADLNLAGNLLSGPLPWEWNQNLTALTKFSVRGQRGSSQLSGPLLEFSNAPQLTTLDVAYNQFAGPLPPDLLSGLTDKETTLVTVDVTSNHFTGGIPVQYRKFYWMALYASDNFLDQPIPPALCTAADDDNTIHWKGALGYSDSNSNNSSSCDFILCPPGSWAPFGRATSPDDVCIPCNDDMDPEQNNVKHPGATYRYFGATDCSSASGGGSSSDGDEAGALMAFFQATNGEEWVNNNRWGESNLNVCSWHGVVCDFDSNVIGLTMENNGLDNLNNNNNDDDDYEQQQQPEDILALLAPLTKLESMDLKGNKIQLGFLGDVSFSRMTSLRISKTMVSSLQGLDRFAPALQSFHAMDNSLTGPFPSEVFQLTQLQALYLSFNHFNGTLPETISDLTQLKELYLYDNEFEGQLPASIATMENLRELVLGVNKFSGTIPPEYSNMTNLEQLSMQNQKGPELIEGPLPDFAGAVHLWYLDISNNDIGPLIPEKLLDGSTLHKKPVTLLMGNNDFTGAIPVTLDQFEQLFIDLSNNRITGLDPTLCDNGGWMNGAVADTGNSCDSILCPPGFFADLGRQDGPDRPCAKCDGETTGYYGQRKCLVGDTERSILISLFEKTNGANWVKNEGWGVVTSPICSWQGITCSGDLQDDDGVEKINLEDNQLQGTLPFYVWTLPYLKEVVLRGNAELTVSLSNMAGTSLEILDVSDIKRLLDLGGITEARFLREFYADQSGLYGPFPEELLSIPTLQAIHMNWNFLAGILPTGIGTLSNLKYLHLAGNDFHGPIPSNIRFLGELEELVLDDCLISGTLPATELSYLPQLQHLSVVRIAKSGRKISGPLPAFDKVSMLESLGFEGNALSGTIPSNFLASSTRVDEVVLDGNDISGSIPEGLVSMSSMLLSITENEIEQVPEEFCLENDWVKETTSLFSSTCEAFLCPPNTANKFGRAVDLSNPCTPCDNQGGTPFYGSTSCQSPPDQRTVLKELYEALRGSEWYRNDYWLSSANVCDWYGIMCDKGHVVGINLELNNLMGVFPTSIYDLPKLQMLWLNNNQLDMDFTNIGRAKSLLDLRIESIGLKSLNGMGNARLLTALSIAYNYLGGTFPDELLLLENIRYLNLNGNGFTGPLPSSFSSLRYLRHFQLSQNEFNGTMPAFSDSMNLFHLSMSHNNISGTIPNDFLSSIPLHVPVRVDLSFNQLEGSIPDTLGRFHKLNLTLTQNQITEVPTSLCNKTDWNGGDVGRYGCDAIACPPGMSSHQGRYSTNDPCVACPEADPQLFGQTTCTMSSNNLKAESSYASSFRMNKAVLCVISVMAGLVLR